MHANLSGVVTVRGETFVLDGVELRRLKASEFIRHAAQCIHEIRSIGIPREMHPKGWERYIVMTQPESLTTWPVDDIESTRVLRFLLAAAIAESEGN